MKKKKMSPCYNIPIYNIPIREIEHELENESKTNPSNFVLSKAWISGCSISGVYLNNYLIQYLIGLLQYFYCLIL